MTFADWRFAIVIGVLAAGIVLCARVILHQMFVTGVLS